jgi:hypothetical protein
VFLWRVGALVNGKHLSFGKILNAPEIKTDTEPDAAS